MALVEVRDLRRSFHVRPRRRGVVGAIADLFGGETREVRALDGVSFDLDTGGILGFIGPNGAGKSTTVKCLTGILQPTGGTVRVDGRDPWAQRREHVQHLGVVFGQRTQLWWDLAVIEAFDLLAALFRVSSADYDRRLSELSALLDLKPLLRTPVRELSLGQRMRCDLAAALLHGPRLLVLDEPTIGLDVAVKYRVREFVRTIAAERGVSVFLTTHDLGDVEELCDRVLLIDAGKAVFEGGLDDLRARLGGARRLVVDTRQPVDDAQLATLQADRLGPAGFSVPLPSEEAAGPRVQQVMAAVEVADLRIVEPSVEEIVAAFYEDRS